MDPPGCLALFFSGPSVYVQGHGNRSRHGQNTGEPPMSDAATLQADEKLAVDLMAAIRAASDAACAPDTLELVSVTLDVSARIEAPAKATFETRIDRRTRTILFVGGSASVGGKVVMTATAVYSIRPA